MRSFYRTLRMAAKALRNNVLRSALTCLGIIIGMKGDEIACYLDGKKELEAHDNTITKEGKVGLWTKADAQSHFDDFKVSVK